ncbi:MAG: hypothetical protein AUI15_35700 [Actinobacteria bacterium 13_2_20CM_2_66_6]|nr:MAG: hypothetical protein AUI15_35700 [Actinobacteria bacterium 13_2_20CM_2_66_6]TME93925.1 MAG: hypothetical protein E6I34_04720 [Chloroflexota bacterium]
MVSVADFMAQARELLRAGPNTKSLHQVGILLAEASAKPGFIPEVEMHRLHGGDSTFTVLQTDPDGLTLMLARFSPAEETPVHDHSSWGVACVVKGKDRYRHWQLAEDGHLSVLYEKELGPGSFVTWSDPPEDIHSQQGIDEPATELVLFGRDVTTIPRRYYDPETGDVRTALPQ